MISHANNTLSSKFSIKSQTVAIMVAGIAVMVMLLSFFISYVVQQQSKALMLKNAFQITEGLAKQAVFPILSGSKENADAAINQVLGFQPVFTARLRVEHNKVFIEKSKYQQTIPIKTHQPTNTEVIEENESSWLVSTPVKVINDNDSEFDFDNSALADETIGYAEVLFSKTSLIEAQRKITTIIFLVGFICALLLSILLYIGLVKLFNPLNTLANTMAHAEQSGEHKLAPIEGAKEVRNMANSYNSMMHVLEKQEESITKHRDQLEKEVEIRTRELVQARDTALTANRHKSEFMANMSHELRTPIQSIIGYGELITEELEIEGNVDLIDDMDKVTNNAQRLLTMINTLLDLAKIEAGKLDLHNADIKVSQLITSLEEVISPIAGKNNNQLEIINQLKLTDFNTDKEKLEQVLINLLSNACKFTENGLIRLTIKEQNQHMVFEVSDTGIGLTEEQQEYIFEEFRQVDGGQSRKFSGTGLGLAISLRFVKLMQGELSVTSQLGKGAKFTVLLPIT